MKREEAKELLPVIQAFAEGKMIQDKIDGLTDWVDTDEINLEYNGQKIKHRIKPQPEYRPFKSRDECWNEMHKHPDFGWVKSKEDQYINILSVDDNKSFSNWFKFYTFTDGKPFGIEENL